MKRKRYIKQDKFANTYSFRIIHILYYVTEEFEMVVFWKEWLDKVQLFERTDISKVVYKSKILEDGDGQWMEVSSEQVSSK